MVKAYQASQRQLAGRRVRESIDLLLEGRPRQAVKRAAGAVANAVLSKAPVA